MIINICHHRLLQQIQTQLVLALAHARKWPHVGGIVVVNGGQWPREAYGLRGGGLEGGLGTALEAGWRLGVGAAARFFARLCAVLGIGRGSWWMFAYASVAYRIRSSRWPADATLKVGVDI
nr:hypothetical protein L203_00286 [Cryptococcus depauperatus CBS 7841]